MAYGDQTGELYTTGGTPNAGLAVRDLARAAVSGITPMVQEVVHGVTAIQSYTRTVPTPGTAVHLNGGTTQPCLQVAVQALESNSGPISVGGTSTLATSGSVNGIILYPRELISFEIDDANDICIDARVAGEGVSYVVMT
jgi:hypothetical protein